MISYILQSIIAFLLVILVVVITHEFGHYLASRLFGIVVTDFSIGFGPTLFKFKDKYGTTWRICAIPLGGYIKHLGDINVTSLTGSAAGLTKKQTRKAFFTQKAWKKVTVAIAGPTANFVTAILVFTCLFYFTGKSVSDNKIMAVDPKGAAHKSGLKAGDIIKSIDDDEVKDLAIAERTIASHPNIPLKFEIERDGQVFTTIIIPTPEELQQGQDKYTVGKIGVVPHLKRKKYDLIPAVVTATQETWNFSVLILRITGQLITGTRSIMELGSVIRISRASREAINQGFDALAIFIAIISINVGIFNLFPIPPLDGGAAAVHIVGAFVNKKAANKFENYAIRVGIVLLLIIMLVAFVSDLKYLKDLK